METFFQVFGFVAAVSLGIIILTVLFTTVGYFKRVTRGFDIVKMKGFIKNGCIINVHLSSGKILAGVRFIGFTDQATGRGGVPYQLASVVVLETAKKARIYVRADSVRMFEEIEDASKPPTN
jgi:hypothetical protein